MVRFRRYAAAALGLLFLGAGGCGGDASVTIIIGPTPPRVVAISPGNGAVDVDTSTAVSATFSVDMVATSINDSTFRLRSASGSVASLVSYEPGSRTASLKPFHRLLPLTTYTVTISSAVRSESGYNLPSDFIWSFSTRDEGGQALGSPGAGESPGIHALSPEPGQSMDSGWSVATLADGDSLAVWEETERNGKSTIMASRYDAASGGWGSVESLGAQGWNPRVAVDAEGNFNIVWDEEQGLESRIVSAEKGFPN
jgi:hypothetical protein